MTEVTDKLLERVRKLLAVANDERANEGERDNALRMANNIMAKYQIDQSMVPQEQRDKDEPIGRFDSEGWYIIWCNQIRNSIARLFSCKYLQGGKINATRGRHIFIGRASNVTTAMLMSEWIVKEALREADKVGGHRLSAAGRSFGMGVAARLSARVTELLAKTAEDIARETGEAVVTTGTSLVVIRQNELASADAWMREHIAVGKARGSSKGAADADAYHAGRKHADRVNLSKQVSAKPDPKALS
jgi:hypothetical protein